MDLQQSNSNSFNLLDERVRRWIWESGWSDLRLVQEKAIPLILSQSSDVIISAPTSAGKTEAAFFPILTKILETQATSVRCLYVSPLKALINDQFQRLEHLTDLLEIPVHKWHGDVSASAKSKLIKKPSGILLITPESLEAMLMRYGHHLATTFPNLEYVVIDEIHSFIGNERGAQLQSLLHRIECLTSKRTTRIGLSATLSDPAVAAHFMRPNSHENFSIVKDNNTLGAIKAQLRGFYLKDKIKSSDLDDDESFYSAEVALVQHLYEATKGKHNLIFCNSKKDVEIYADALSQTCSSNHVLDEYCTHHGNLSKEIRESAEARLKSKDSPTTCVCTSTLEMGIDIGSVFSVGQIGPPPSVSSLRQRVGRSGRRGEAAILRAVITEFEPTAKSNLVNCLHLGLIRSIASIELMKEGWCEPPQKTAYHLSTLIQQTMSLIVQRGGASIVFLYEQLIRNGTFSVVKKQEYIALLRAMRENDVVKQMDDGTLLLGNKGEKIAEHYSFYAAFSTPEEYQLVADGKPVGTLPIVTPLKVGDPLLFAGKRWEIIEVQDERRVITLRRSRGGRAPFFSGDTGIVHATIRKKMNTILEGCEIPAYLDYVARHMLQNARQAYKEAGLQHSNYLQLGPKTFLFHWQGDRESATLRLLLESKGLKVDPYTEILIVDGEYQEVATALKELTAMAEINKLTLSAQVKNKIQEKYDWILPEELLNISYAQNELDTEGALEIARLFK